MQDVKAGCLQGCGGLKKGILHFGLPNTVQHSMTLCETNHKSLHLSLLNSEPAGRIACFRAQGLWDCMKMHEGFIQMAFCRLVHPLVVLGPPCVLIVLLLCHSRLLPASPFIFRCARLIASGNNAAENSCQSTAVCYPTLGNAVSQRWDLRFPALDSIHGQGLEWGEQLVETSDI